MACYATFDASGRFSGAYQPGVNCDAAPAAAVTITVAQRDVLVANPDGYRWDGSAVVATDATLAVYKARQIAKLYAACDAFIAAGFSSAALGSAHTYPMKLTDQQNRDSAYLDIVDMLTNPTGNVLAGTTAWLFWCQDLGTGGWARVGHTAAQVRQARLDTRTALIAVQAKLAGLVAQVNAATTPAAAQAVAW